MLSDSKTFIIDTNVLLFDPLSINKFGIKAVSDKVDISISKGKFKLSTIILLYFIFKFTLELLTLVITNLDLSSPE